MTGWRADRELGCMRHSRWHSLRYNCHTRQDKGRAWTNMDKLDQGPEDPDGRWKVEPGMVGACFFLGVFALE